MAIRPDYSVGTVSLAAGGTVVTGVGSLWVAADIQPGDTFKVQNLDAIILSVDSNTEITLAEPWTGTALSGDDYAIRYQPDGSRYAAAARTLIELLGNGNLTAFAALAGALNMIPMFTGAGALTLVPKSELTQGVDYDVQVGTLAERASYDGQAVGFTVLVSDVGDGRAAIYSKASGTLGDWTDPAFLTGPSGSFQSKGDWTGAAAYNIGDVVFYQGSSWIALVDHTNHAPPTLPTTTNTWWTILVRAGSGFTFRGTYSGATAYLKDDVVIDQGSSWIALQATTGSAPPTLPATSNANWQALAVKGQGDVSGPGSSVDSNLAAFNGTTGKTIKDSLITTASVFDARKGVLWGLTMTRNATDPTNDVDIAPGVAADENNANPHIMRLLTGVTTQVDVPFGTGNGGRFDAAIADNTFYHYYLISNGVNVKVGMSVSLNPTTAPNYPSGYTSYRRIFTVPRVSGSLVNLRQYGDRFYRPAVTIFTFTTSLSPTLIATGAPPGLTTRPMIQANASVQAGSSAQISIGDSNAGGVTETVLYNFDAGLIGVHCEQFTTSDPAAARLWFSSSISGALFSLTVSGIGWIDDRGRIPS